MSWIWGAMRAAEAGLGAPELASLLDQAADAGAEAIDLADIYGGGRCEALVGEALALAPTLRRRLRLIAKAGVVFKSGAGALHAHHYRNDAAWLEARLDDTLARLGVEAVDLFLVHRPDYLMDAADTAAALERMVETGKANAVGVSNFTTAQHARLAGALGKPAAAWQIELSVFETSALEDGRLDQAMSDGAEVQAWSPLGGGRLFDAQDDAAGRVRAVLAAACGSDDPDTLAGAALAFLARHGAGVKPILGSTRPQRLAAQARAMGETRFDAEAWYAVLEAARGKPVA